MEKINLYLLTGKDPSSDLGYFTVLINASSIDEVENIFNNHLKMCNRDDDFIDCTVELLDLSVTVPYSNLEDGS